jgi:predicted dehydrogenase
MSVGVQTDGGAMFIAGMSTIMEPPKLDMWTVAEDRDRWEDWNREDSAFFESVNPMEHYHRLQIEDFLDALVEDREPAITGRDGRVTVEIFTAIYRSMRDRAPVVFPVQPERGRDDFDGRIGGDRGARR